MASYFTEVSCWFILQFSNKRIVSYTHENGSREIFSFLEYFFSKEISLNGTDYPTEYFILNRSSVLSFTSGTLLLVSTFVWKTKKLKAPGRYIIGNTTAHKFAVLSGRIFTLCIDTEYSIAVWKRNLFTRWIKMYIYFYFPLHIILNTCLNDMVQLNVYCTCTDWYVTNEFLVIIGNGEKEMNNWGHLITSRFLHFVPTQPDYFIFLLT